MDTYCAHRLIHIQVDVQVYIQVYIQVDVATGTPHKPLIIKHLAAFRVTVFTTLKVAKMLIFNH